MKEIEIKARITDHILTEQRVREIATFEKECTKRDFYWNKFNHDPLGGKEILIRIRECNSEIIVTYKRKDLQGNVEINEEQEFKIDHKTAFEALLTDLGFAPYICKEKQTKTFVYNSLEGIPVTIEISHLTGLGDFIEIEIILDSSDELMIGRAQGMLHQILALCGVPKSAIESRYYIDLLRDPAKKQAAC